MSKVDTWNPLLPPQPLQRRDYKIKVPLQGFGPQLTHFDGKSNPVEKANGLLVSAALLIGISHTPDGKKIHWRNSQKLRLVFGQIELPVLFFKIERHGVFLPFYFPFLGFGAGSAWQVAVVRAVSSSRLSTFSTKK